MKFHFKKMTKSYEMRNLKFHKNEIFMKAYYKKKFQIL